LSVREKCHVLVTHTDLDGIGSAAVYIRLGLKGKNYRVVFAEPEELPEILEDLWDRYGGFLEKLSIMDLAPNPNNVDRILVILRTFRESGARIEWFDHHEWDREIITMISSVAEVRIDKGTCATGVTASSFEERDPYIASLVSAICSLDLWSFHDPLSPWLGRLSTYRRDNLWRTILLEMLVKSSTLEEVVTWGRKYIERVIDRELYLYNYYRKRVRVAHADGVKIASIVKKHREISTSHLAHYILSISISDIALIINPSGPLSLRSRKCDVRIIAIKLGGGGHKPAAGAFIRAPLLHRILYRLGLEEPLHRYVLSRVTTIVRSTGCVPITASSR
jgi:oligoribonuclease NrnB/cAMP/cGMP phosphodiesterase (DHH superfamily)